MSIEEIRIINFGDVSWLDSQAIYHSVAHAFRKDSTDTITIMSPTDTYVSIGYFQELEKEVDTGFCRENDIPVVRREVGGGAVLLDSDQLFFHYIFNKGRVPRDIGEVYKKFLAPVTGTYQRLGLDVYHRPINDLQIEGRKIGGTGAVEIGNSTVVVGSFMFDFNYGLMPRILKVPSEKFRDKIYRNVTEYVTSIKGECQRRRIPLPGREEVANTFLEEVQKGFGRGISFDSGLNSREKAHLEIMRKKLISESWLKKKGKFYDRKVKITADVNVYEGNCKCPGGLIRVTAAIKNDVIDDISISGDFTLIPNRGLSLMEDTLAKTRLEKEIISKKIEQSYKKYGIRSPGVTPQDFVEAIISVLKGCF
ncbi:MAG: lipoyl protein ligase domain-containing protein [Actinomycetota bacterium]